MSKKPKKITVVDADSIAYRCAAASERRYIEVTHTPTGTTKEFDTRTEFKALLKSKNKLDKLQEYSIEDKQLAEPIENCLSSVKAQVERIKERTEADELDIVVGGKSTYRESLPLPTLYKSARADVMRPVHLKEAKRYLIDVHKAQEVQGIEADDLVIQKVYAYRDMRYDTTLSSNDKDSLQIEGFRIYDHSKDVFIDVNGCSIELIKKASGNKVQGCGIGFLSYQMLVGDITDGYKPTELAGVKYGDVSAYKDLKDCKEPKDYLKVVARKYQEWYPTAVTYKAWDGTEHTKDWKEILQMYWKCAYMLRHEFDEADATEFFALHGVQL
jgi:hypothetical protein